MTGRVGPVARALGYAGLLPQAAAVAMLAATRWVEGAPNDPGLPVAVAVVYPLVILSFLGGMWWGFAMRRGEGQGRLAAVAVTPSLAALALFATLAATAQVGWSLIAVGGAVMLTLLVDRRLVATGEAPDGWMRLRVPLSLGLGGLTIVAGALIGGPVTGF